ncbi:PilN domain-containing protein [Acinetobacter larvae]|uniref:Fimbrial assembly protein n=1 Tax=Acinetobacter larvae TaxID=1789224 RepID=A0A1B2M345_9GAMM|nr:PilN domain-containing protein [Acinetobacter larvae]AOA59443.1 hypothetical protein BFG52_14525 [Acinetobacter larvae]
MTRINLLPWRQQQREFKRQQFMMMCICMVMLALLLLILSWFYVVHQLNDQQQANQLIKNSNQNIQVQLKGSSQQQQQHQQLLQQIAVLQNIEAQRPLTARILQEIATLTPANLYLIKLNRQGQKMTLQGRAENPDAVTQLLNALAASQWFQAGVMHSYQSPATEQTQRASAAHPTADYGDFVVDVALSELAYALRPATAGKEQ